MTPAVKEGLPAVVGELLPCPFCGDEPKLHTWSEHRYARIQCESCNFEWDYFDTTKEAAEAWNRRATLSALTAEAGKGEAVAFTVVGPDGKSSIGGWMDMRVHEAAQTWAVLREGHRYAYAYEGTPALSIATPAGEWVLVPREPNNNMQIAGLAALDRSDATPESIGSLIGYKAVREAYRAMLAASPRGASAGEG